MRISKVLAYRIKRNHPALYVVDADATVKEVAWYMSQNNIGGALVKKAAPAVDEYIGIISERDIVKCCAICDELESVKVKSIMSEGLITADINDNAITVSKQMYKNHIRHIPLSDNGKIIALISIRDLIYCIDREKDHMMTHMNDVCGNLHYNTNY
jgi:CBS domain-containing protein